LSEAIEEFERQLADYTPRWRLVLGIYAVKSYYYLALAYEQSNQFDKAIATYEQFLSIWIDADPVMAEIEDARARLAVLKSKS
jgi:tetratricopeptide (TPR) repeat protein